MKVNEYIKKRLKEDPDFAREYEKLKNPKTKEYLRVKTEEFVSDLCGESGRSYKQVINMVAKHLERIINLE